MTRRLAAALVVLAAGCGGEGDEQAALPRGSEPVELDAADFVDRIDNPYLPFARGSRWVYRETDGEGNEQRVEVTVTNRTKAILGIAATVVHDVVSAKGEVVEDTLDWYAQDRDGNVWYLGEQTAEYEDGKLVSREGSWEAGVDGAQAGIVMPAHPEVGMRYRQEYYEGHAGDRGEVLRVDDEARVPFGSYREVVRTKDTTPLEPQVREHKYYARGVGLVLARDVAGGGREELVLYDPG